MATVLVKNLPSVSTTDDDDLLIVNIGGGNEYTTSNIKIGDLRTVLNSSGNSFTSDVEVDGSVTITDVATQSGKTFVGNLVGNVTGQATSVSDISNHSTDTLSEGSNNKYFTDANFLVEFEKAPIGRLADVTISGNGTATSGKFLLHNGTAFVDTEIATYDQRTDITALDGRVATLEADYLVGDADTLAAAVAYTDTEVADAKTAVNLYTDIAVADAKTEVNLYTDTEVADALAAVQLVQDDVDANEVTAAADSAAAQDTADKIQTKLAGLTAATYTANDVAELQGIITTLIGELKTALS